MVTVYRTISPAKEYRFLISKNKLQKADIMPGDDVQITIKKLPKGE